MKTVNATDAKNRFGELLDESQKEPISIMKNGRKVAVIMSAAQYQFCLDQVSIDDLVEKYHDESIERYSELYEKLAR